MTFSFSSFEIISLELSKTCFIIKISLFISFNIESDGFDLPGTYSNSASNCLSLIFNPSGLVDDVTIVKSNLIIPCLSSDLIIKLTRLLNL